jgi:hypothetical protein
MNNIRGIIPAVFQYQSGADNLEGGSVIRAVWSSHSDCCCRFSWSELGQDWPGINGEIMKLRILLTLLPALLIGCGPSPENPSVTDEQTTAPQTKVRQTKVPLNEVPDPDGFFTGLTQFIDVEDMTAINTHVIRLNKRHDLLIKHHQDRIQGAKIIDFGSYDGRWAYAAIEAGAEHVTGVEINPIYAEQANNNLKELGVSADRYDFVVDDIMTRLKNTEPGTYDGVICAGIYYHITYHVELMAELKRIGVKWIIMDTTALKVDEPIIKWVAGPNGLNGLEGIPSPSAVEMIAEAAGFKYEYVPIDHLTSEHMWDYRWGNRIAMTIYE